MRDQGQAFPEAMVDLVGVGEQTGSLPDILKSLAGHFENQIRLRRTFISAITWPAFQMVAAILIIGLLLYILGWIAQSHGGGKPIDILGLGLYGTEGAMTWFAMTFGTLIGGFVAGMIIRRSLMGQRIFDGLILQIPVIGGCMRSFAIARFSWSFALTQQAGMSIEPSLDTELQGDKQRRLHQSGAVGLGPVREGEYAARRLGGNAVSFRPIICRSSTWPRRQERCPRRSIVSSPELEAQARRSMETLASALAWAHLVRGGRVYHFLDLPHLPVLRGPAERCPETGVREVREGEGRMRIVQRFCQVSLAS